MLGQSVLLVALVLLRPAHQRPVVSRVGKHVVSLAPFGNHSQLSWRKGLELLLLDGSLGHNYLEASRDEKILLALGLRTGAGTADCQGYIEAPRR
jgi:hypothetical protein